MPIKSVEVKVQSRVPLIELGGGIPGPQGTSIVGAVVNGSGHLILTLSNGNTIDSGYVIGPAGPIVSISETGNGIIIDNSVSSAPVLSLDATLEAVANFATGAGLAMYWTGTDTLGSYTTTAFSRGFMGAVDAAAGRTALVLGSVAVLTAGTAAGNVPVLDGSGQLPTSVLPALAITETYVVASQAAMLALTAQRGDVAVRSDLNKSFILATDSSGTLADWKELLTPTDAVLSVAGLTGAIGAANLLTAIGLATGNSPQFAGLNIGHATDTTLGRTSAGVINVEGIDVLLTTLQQDVSNKDLTDSSVNIVDATDRTKKLQLAADLVPSATTNVLTVPPASGVILTDPIAVSSVLPTLDLRFTNIDGAPFDDYFARSGAGGYRVNAKGVLVPTVDREPVIDYSAGTALGTGFYGAYTNLLLRSEEFDNAAWTKSECTISANAVTAPDGSTTTDKIVESTNNVDHSVRNASGIATGVATCTFSIFAKAAERSQIKLTVFEGSSLATVGFDLSANSILSGSGGTIVAVGNDWYRCSVTVAVVTGASVFCFAMPMSGGVSTYPGNGVSGIYVWGAQLTATTFPVPYVPTTSATVARAADSMVITGSDFTDFFNPLEGTFFIDCVNCRNGYLATFSRGVGSYGPRIQTSITGGGFPGSAVVNNSNTVVSDLATAIATGTAKMATTYKTNEFRLCANGGTVVSDSAGDLPTGLVSLEIGRPPDGDPVNVHQNGYIRRMIYWPKALSATELQRMTA